MTAVPNGKMSWEEIKKAYPDEWVLLDDLDVAEDDTTVTGGRVLDHDRSKKAVYARNKPDRPVSWATLFTGPIGRGSYRL